MVRSFCATRAVARYLELLSVINGWPAPESMAPALDWFLDAVRAAANRGDPRTTTDHPSSSDG